MNFAGGFEIDPRFRSSTVGEPWIAKSLINNSKIDVTEEGYFGWRGTIRKWRDTFRPDSRTARELRDHRAERRWRAAFRGLPGRSEAARLKEKNCSAAKRCGETQTGAYGH
jgi:cyclopropane fatty-acyl-phospholipid synthase-like methyltransferase